jgi:hypothetical protein
MLFGPRLDQESLLFAARHPCVAQFLPTFLYSFP